MVVNYNTDSWRDEADLHAKVDRYAVQLDAYGLGVPEVADESAAIRGELVGRHGRGGRAEGGSPLRLGHPRGGERVGDEASDRR